MPWQEDDELDVPEIDEIQINKLLLKPIPLKEKFEIDNSWGIRQRRRVSINPGVIEGGEFNKNNKNSKKSIQEDGINYQSTGLRRTRKLCINEGGYRYTPQSKKSPF